MIFIVGGNRLGINKNLELLAPAGNWESLETVIKAGADAVYLGGKKHNMRLLRDGFNFNNDQLKQAVKFGHQHNVKIYITVNNLQSDDELADIKTYLEFLSDIGPDALIVQDLGLIQLINKMGISIPLHSSVMMNVHNKGMIEFLKAERIKRFIVSRELSFSQVGDIYNETGAELEYFIHGDMCFSQSGQCLLSGMLFGNSSNRGRCLKPCRWQYELAEVEGSKINKIDTKVDGSYFMAVKDMCLYRFIPELIQSEIISFKVEGRMKPPVQLYPIINSYRQAIDAYLEDPVGYRTNEEDYKQLLENRVRDFSTCFSLENSGAEGIGYSGEREPKFFSEAGLEREIVLDDILNDKRDLTDSGNDPSLSFMQIAAGLAEKIEGKSFKTALSIKVVNLQQLEAALESGVDRIYFGGEIPTAYNPVGKELINEALKRAAEYDVELILATPRITMPEELNEYISLFQNIDSDYIDGIMAGNIGMINIINVLTGLPVYADFGVNAFNSLALKLLKKRKVIQTTVQLESSLKQAVDLAAGMVMPLEIIGHGYLPFMVSDHCLISELSADCSLEEKYPAICKDKCYALINKEGGVYRIMTDQYCRNHLYLAKELSLLPILNQIVDFKFASFRIEGQFYGAEKIKSIVPLYKKAFNYIKEGVFGDKLQQLWLELQELSDNGYTLAAYEKGVLAKGK